jgi:hypothetical protein
MNPLALTNATDACRTPEDGGVSSDAKNSQALSTNTAQMYTEGKLWNFMQHGSFLVGVYLYLAGLYNCT